MSKSRLLAVAALVATGAFGVGVAQAQETQVSWSINIGLPMPVLGTWKFIPSTRATGIDTAGKPRSDHSVQHDGSPVALKPIGAVEGAAGESTASYSSSHPVKNAMPRSRLTSASR